jgi:hypothetical protein
MRVFCDDSDLPVVVLAGTAVASVPSEVVDGVAAAGAAVGVVAAKAGATQRAASSAKQREVFFMGNS